MTSFEHIVAELLGLPYALGGRGPEAFDCYGLVREFHRRRGLELPPGDTEEAVAPHFVAVAQPQPGDVVKYLMPEGPHVGIWLRDGVLTAAKPVSRVLHHRHVRRFATGYFRHRSLVC